MEPKLAQTEVAVVGGGMAGLTAACYLARAGLEVTVFEKALTLGDARRPGSSMVSCSTVEDTPCTPEVRAPESSRSWAHLRPRHPEGHLRAAGGKLSSFPANPLGLLRRGDFLSAGDKLALFRFFVAISRARPGALARTSVQEWLDGEIRRPHRRVMTGFARTFAYSTALDLVSAEMFVEKFQRALRHPVHYVDGGWQVLVDGLRDAAEQAGARRAAPASNRFSSSAIVRWAFACATGAWCGPLLWSSRPRPGRPRDWWTCARPDPAPDRG